MLHEVALDDGLRRNQISIPGFAAQNGGRVMMEPATDRKFANTFAQGLGVLRAFRASDSGLTHAEIAEWKGLPKPMISRLTYTLCELGYLSHAGRNARFRLGPAAVALGSVASLSIGFVDLAAKTMQELGDKTGTLALIAVRDGQRMLLVKTWRPQGVATIWLEPGHRIPMFGSSSGWPCLQHWRMRGLRGWTRRMIWPHSVGKGMINCWGRGFV